MNDVNFLKENLIAHRGFFDTSLGIPENSLSAFQMAIDFNYGIELDIRLSKDNKIVVFHDDNLKRMTGIDKAISDCTYKELKKLSLQDTEEKIPLLKDVLNLINGKVPLLIEFKSDKNLKILEYESMRLLKKYNGKYAIQSFNPMCVNFFRKNYPNIPRGQLSRKKTKGPYISRFILGNMLFNFITKPDFISYDISKYDAYKVVKWKEKRPVLGWTVKNKVDYKLNKGIFSNLICENMENYIKK